VIPALLTGGLVALVALGLWIRWLYQRGDQVPDLRASLKVTVDRRDELSRLLAEAVSREARLRAELRTALDAVRSISATMRRETDTRIEAATGDAGAQLRLADELLGRPWPEGSGGTGADGGRAGGVSGAVSATAATAAPPLAGR
jgi:hypothetical protein